MAVRMCLLHLQHSLFDSDGSGSVRFPNPLSTTMAARSGHFNPVSLLP